MAEDKKGVIDAQAPEQDAKSPSASEGKPQPEAEVTKLKEELAKVTRDRDNYRAGLLAKKEFDKRAKQGIDLSEPEKVEELLDAKLEQKKLEEKAERETEAEREAREKLEAENAELRRALESSRSSSSPVGGAGRSESEAKPQGYWSDDQRNELRQILNSRGFYSQQQVDTIVKMAESRAQKGTALSPSDNVMVKKRQY